MIQNIIVFVVILAAVLYSVYRIREAMRRANDRCYGCTGCAMREQLMKNARKTRKRPDCYTNKKG